MAVKSELYIDAPDRAHKLITHSSVLDEKFAKYRERGLLHGPLKTLKPDSVEQLKERKARNALELLSMRGKPSITVDVAVRGRIDRFATWGSQNKVYVDVAHRNGNHIGEVVASLGHIIVAAGLEDNLTEFENKYLYPYRGLSETPFSRASRAGMELKDLEYLFLYYSKIGAAEAAREISEMKTHIAKQLLAEAAVDTALADLITVAKPPMNYSRLVALRLPSSLGSDGAVSKVAWDNDFDSLVEAVGGYSEDQEDGL